MKKILIINAYSNKNRGDSGIIISMIDIIRKAYGNEGVKISVMSQYHKSNIEFYDNYNVKSVEPIWNINDSSKSFVSKYIEGIKKVYNYQNEDLVNYNEADMVLSAGGGYLYSSRKGVFGIGFLNCLYHIWLGKKLKKKVLLFPQSVGPLNSFFDRWVLKRVFDKVDVFYSREYITTNLAKKLNLKCKVKEVPDIAFTLNPEIIGNDDQNFKFCGGKKIGITVLDWRFAKSNSNKDDIYNYLNKISKSINLLKNDYEDIKVYIFPQVTVSEDDGDMAASLQLKEILGDNAKVVSLEEINNPEQLVYLYSKMDAFIASRMHSAIFALAGNTPTVALSYQPKTLGTFRLINNEEYALDIEHFTEVELHQKLIKVLSIKSSEIDGKIKSLKALIEDKILNDLLKI